jgi:peroxiredoxin (alkyl hydroperoxide reductase subunit C)
VLQLGTHHYDAIFYQERDMKTVGDKLSPFEVVGVKPGFNEHQENNESAFMKINETSFSGKWKVIYYYPKDFTFVCPTEIVAFSKLTKDFELRDCVLMGGSTDNEFCKLAWRRSHPDLNRLNHWSFADTLSEYGKHDETVNDFGETDTVYRSNLIDQLGIRDTREGVALRATFIVDPNNVIQHVSVNNLNVGRNPEEILRILDGLQSDELCPCNRQVGGATLGK